MLRSKKLKKINTINHGFFNSLGGFSSGIYKSLNCGMGSKDNKKYVKKIRLRIETGLPPWNIPFEVPSNL